MEDNRDSYLINALLDNYEDLLDISLISNNPFIPLIRNNFKTPTNQKNEKQHLLPESTQNVPPNLITKLLLNLNQFRNGKVLLIKNVKS